MKKLFFIIMSLIALSSFSQQGTNPVSVTTVKHCIDEYALKDFKDLKRDSLYGTAPDNDSKYYWSRYKLLYELGSDSSFVLYTSAYDRHSLEFFYGFDSDAEERILKVVNEVIWYYVKKSKWTKDDEVDNPDNELVLLDKKDRMRLKFSRNNETGISVLEIFSVKD